MLSRIGEIRYLRVLYGSDKAPVTKDQVMFSNYNLGEQFSQSDYTSNHIDGEEFLSATGAANEIFSLAWTPVVPNSITLLFNDVEYTDNGQGQITIPNNVLNIDYKEGRIVTTNALPAGTSLSFTYDYNNMDVPVHAPDIKIRIVTSPIQAKSRKLKTLYSFDSAFLGQVYSKPRELLETLIILLRQSAAKLSFKMF